MLQEANENSVNTRHWPKARENWLRGWFGLPSANEDSKSVQATGIKHGKMERNPSQLVSIFGSDWLRGWRGLP